MGLLEGASRLSHGRLVEHTAFPTSLGDVRRETGVNVEEVAHKQWRFRFGRGTYIPVGPERVEITLSRNWVIEDTSGRF